MSNLEPCPPFEEMIPGKPYAVPQHDEWRLASQVEEGKRKLRDALRDDAE
jgi:hypothetical protein